MRQAYRLVAATVRAWLPTATITLGIGLIAAWWWLHTSYGLIAAGVAVLVAQYLSDG